MIRQGHAYSVFGCGRCIALESKALGDVRCLTVGDDDLYPLIVTIPAQKLQPAPMRYFHGETPQ